MCYNELMQSILDFLIPAAQAHEKWFIDPANVQPVANQFLAWRPATIAGLLAVAAAAVIGYILDRRFEKSGLHQRMENRVRPLRDLATIVIAASTGLYFLWLSIQGAYMADNFTLAALGSFGPFLMLVQALVGAFLIIGLYTSATSALVVLMYLSLFAFFGWQEPLDYLHYAGIGIFLYYFSRNRYSLDWFLGKPIFTTPEVRKRAYLALRVLTGVTILGLASLKLFRPEVHFALMDAYSKFNPYVILQWLGLSSLSREAYVFCLFLVEATSGIFITFGFLTRIVAVLLIPLFLVSVMFLGFSEIIGHLPIVGIMFALFLFGDTYTKSPDKK